VNYGAALPGGSLTAIQPGDGLYLWNAETPAAPQASIVLVRALGPTGEAGITFSINFAAAPTDSLQILGSNKPPAAAFTLTDWESLYTSSNKQNDSYTDTARFEYYCAYLASQSAGGALTVIAQR